MGIKWDHFLAITEMPEKPKWKQERQLFTIFQNNSWAICGLYWECNPVSSYSRNNSKLCFPTGAVFFHEESCFFSEVEWAINVRGRVNAQCGSTFTLVTLFFLLILFYLHFIRTRGLISQPSSNISCRHHIDKNKHSGWPEIRLFHRHARGTNEAGA